MRGESLFARLVSVGAVIFLLFALSGCASLLGFESGGGNGGGGDDAAKKLRAENDELKSENEKLRAEIEGLQKPLPPKSKTPNQRSRKTNPSKTPVKAPAAEIYRSRVTAT